MVRNRTNKTKDVKVLLAIDMRQKGIFEAKMPDGNVIFGKNVEDVQEQAKAYLSGIELELIGEETIEDNAVNNYVVI